MTDRTRTISEIRFVIEVTKDFWDRLSDEELNNICEQVDGVVCFAERYLRDGLRTVLGTPTVRRED